VSARVWIFFFRIIFAAAAAFIRFAIVSSPSCRNNLNGARQQGISYAVPFSKKHHSNSNHTTAKFKVFVRVLMDLLTITPTGSGKTGYYIMYMLVILAVLKNPDRFPSLRFPKNPCLMVICPTIPLQLEMVSKHAISAPGLLY
jgi:hypothetical protein